MKLVSVAALLMGFGVASSVYAAAAPVVDAYDEPNTIMAEDSTRTGARYSPGGDATSFSFDQRLTVLERQINNLNPLLVQIDDLKQHVQVLQGRIEEQQHRLKQLEDQVRAQYQVLDRRMNPTTTNRPASSGSSSMSPPSNLSPSVRQVEANTLRSESTVARPPVMQANSDASLPTAAGERAYQAAFQLLKIKQYTPAIEGFENFIKKYPRDVNQSNAHYFLGQLYLLQGQPEQSIAKFNRFIRTATSDPRVPDALLQLGLAYFAKGEKNIATETFKKIVRQYPDSKAAQSAQARLQQFLAMDTMASGNRDSPENGASHGGVGTEDDNV